MLSLEWHFGLAPSILAALQDERLAVKAANAMARAYKEEILNYVEEGRSFTNRGKHLKFIKLKFEGPGAMVYTKAKHLVWMEGGTGPHAISPRGRGKRKAKVLRFKAGGGFLFRKLVQHPGTRPLPFFFADFAAREVKMKAAAQGVLAAKLGAR
jgi:hypothetical protein